MAPNKPKIRPYPLAATDLAETRNGLGGFQVVVANGVNRMNGTGPADPPKHPRSAVGTSDNGQYLWLLAVDGRQPGHSEGMTYAELGDWALSLGVKELLNLDGGGSTTLVVEDSMSGARAWSIRQSARRRSGRCVRSATISAYVFTIGRAI